MKPVQLAALAGIAAAVFVGGYLVVSGRGGQTQSASAKEHPPLLPDFAKAADQIASITFRKDKTDLVLEKQGQKWVIPAKGGYGADNARVHDTLRTFADAKILEEKTSKPDLYARLGVEDPEAAGSAATLVTFKDSGGKALDSVIVGRKQFDGAQASPLDDAAGPKNFVRLAGQAQSYLVSGDFRVETDAKEWLVRSLEDLRPERVREVQTIRQGKVLVDISRPTKDQTKFTLADLPEGRKLKDDYILTRLANCFSGATFDDVAKADTINVNVPDAAEYKVICFDGLVIDAKGVKQGEDWWWGLHADYEAPPAPPADTPHAADAPAKPDASKDDKADDKKDAPASPEAAKDSSAKEEAKPAAPAGPSDDLKSEISAMNERWQGWVFQLPAFKGSLMASTMDDLLAPLPKPGEPAKPGAAMPPGQPPISIPMPK
ncbi:MAG: DUF4340 domain-containing protein [Tepidisphaera sp.]|nr:DUF4340 domain-containing protein [Tepidisphaera sp.]